MSECAPPDAVAGGRSIATGVALAAIHLGACFYHRLLTHRSMRLARPLEYRRSRSGE